MCYDYVMNPPKVLTATALDDKKLLVKFENGISKVYDCTPLLSLEVFSVLVDDALFRSVKVEPGGYAISWTDQVDLAEYALWTHGVIPSAE